MNAAFLFVSTMGQAGSLLTKPHYKTASAGKCHLCAVQPPLPPFKAFKHRCQQANFGGVCVARSTKLRWKCLRLYRTSCTCWRLHLNTAISHLLLSVALGVRNNSVGFVGLERRRCVLGCWCKFRVVCIWWSNCHSWTKLKSKCRLQMWFGCFCHSIIAVQCLTRD